jgi:hypothetical protein
MLKKLGKALAEGFIREMLENSAFHNFIDERIMKSRKTWEMDPVWIGAKRAADEAATFIEKHSGDALVFRSTELIVIYTAVQR